MHWDGLQTANTQEEKEIFICVCCSSEPVCTLQNTPSPLYYYARFVSGGFFNSGDANNNQLADFLHQHLLCHACFGLNVRGRYYTQQPTSLFGHSYFYTTCRACLGMHEPDHLLKRTWAWMVNHAQERVFTIIKWTGLNTQKCFRLCLGPQCRNVLGHSSGYFNMLLC